VPCPHSNHRLAQRVCLRRHRFAFLPQPAIEACSSPALTISKFSCPFAASNSNAARSASSRTLIDDSSSSASLASLFCSAHFDGPAPLPPVSARHADAASSHQPRKPSPQRLNPQFPIANLRPRDSARDASSSTRSVITPDSSRSTITIAVVPHFVNPLRGPRRRFHDLRRNLPVPSRSSSVRCRLNAIRFSLRSTSSAVKFKCSGSAAAPHLAHKFADSTNPARLLR